MYNSSFARANLGREVGDIIARVKSTSLVRRKKRRSRRGLLLANIEPRIDPLLRPMVDGISHPAPY